MYFFVNITASKLENFANPNLGCLLIWIWLKVFSWIFLWFHNSFWKYVVRYAACWKAASNTVLLNGISKNYRIGEYNYVLQVLRWNWGVSLGLVFSGLHKSKSVCSVESTSPSSQYFYFFLFFRLILLGKSNKWETIRYLLSSNWQSSICRILPPPLTYLFKYRFATLSTVFDIK